MAVLRKWIDNKDYNYQKKSRIFLLLNCIAYSILGLFAGNPSIIFGLFGMMFFGETLGLGYSIITVSLTLILMVLPLITRNTQEAFFRLFCFW